MAVIADNTVQSGADTIATDDVTTLNGGASSGVKVQRQKVGFGDDGTYRDASEAFPLPVRYSSGTATLTSVAGTTTSTTILAANTSRRGATLHSTTGSATVYVRLGGGTATSAVGGHSFDLAAGSYYEVPYGFTGAITAIWSAATGGLNVTELT